MDHRVSKDMISSGMTPSGKKTQADLGKTQYGSAPSPNRLMDAYHSMYENQKKETLDEGMVGDVVKKVKDVGKEVKFQVDNVTNKAGKNQKRAIATQIMKNANLNNSVDLLAAYRAVYEHHKKDEDGNTIPHEDDVKEGKIPAGLQAYLDKKKGKKKDDDNGDDEKEGKKKAKKDVKEGAGLYANIHAKRKRGGKMRKKGAKGAPSSQDFANAAKTAREDVDLFDVISTKLIEEGYSEKESYEIMSNLTEEELNEFIVTGTMAALGALKAGGAALAAKGAALAKAVKGSQFAANAGKMLSKVQNIAKKPPVRLSSKGPGSSTGSLSKGNLKFSGDAKYNQMKKGIDPKPSKPNILQRAKDTYNKMTPIEKAATIQTGASLIPRGSVSDTTKKVGTVYASADLFDIVKGQLLDEGLSEEEIKDIMLELTPEEILNEISFTKVGKYMSDASKDLVNTSDSLKKNGPISGDDPRLKRLQNRGAGLKRAGKEMNKQLNNPLGVNTK